MIYRELLLGCGYARDRRIDPFHFGHKFSQAVRVARSHERWLQPITVDNNPACKPDYQLDLNFLSWVITEDQLNGSDLFEPEVSVRLKRFRFKANLFDEIHAYEVLEHLGRQGDELAFFRHFEEIWRLLRPGGFLCATVPSRFSPWLWGDPGHRRAILPESLLFLRQAHYQEVVGQGPSSDYRHMYKGDFALVDTSDNQHTHAFVLQALKPLVNLDDD